jgi:hypothetical protein
MRPKYAEITVNLVGEDGNAFSIIGRVRAALRLAGISDIEIKAFTEQATRSDYDNLLATVMTWVQVE